MVCNIRVSVFLLSAENRQTQRDTCACVNLNVMLEAVVGLPAPLVISIDWLMVKVLGVTGKVKEAEEKSTQ